MQNVTTATVTSITALTGTTARPRTRRLRFDYERAIRRSDLLPSARLVALTIAQYGNSTDGTGAHPGTRTLAAGTGLSRQTVITALAVLRDAGWLIRTSRGGAGSGRGNTGKRGNADTYRLRIPGRDD